MRCLPYLQFYFVKGGGALEANDHPKFLASGRLSQSFLLFVFWITLQISFKMYQFDAERSYLKEI